jgi:addiction module HigA family antidote
MKKFPFGYSIHPGEILKAEFMEPLGLSSYRLATELRVPVPRINNLVREKRSITADTAMHLIWYFGTSGATVAWVADGSRHLARGQGQIPR